MSTDRAPLPAALLPRHKTLSRGVQELVAALHPQRVEAEASKYLEHQAAQPSQLADLECGVEAIWSRASHASAREGGA